MITTPHKPHAISSLLHSDFKSVEGNPLSGIPHFDTNKVTKVASESAGINFKQSLKMLLFSPRSCDDWFPLWRHLWYKTIRYITSLLWAYCLPLSWKCSKTIGNITPLFCLANASFFFQPSTVCFLTCSCFLSSCNSSVKTKTTPSTTAVQSGAHSSFRRILGIKAQ